jgi:hypothetical protein
LHTGIAWMAHTGCVCVHKGCVQKLTQSRWKSWNPPSRNLGRPKVQQVHTPGSPAFRRLRQEDCEFESSLSYRVRLCLKIENKKPKYVAQW